MPIEKPETLRVRSCRCYAFGCMVAIWVGYRMARRWHYTKLSIDYRVLFHDFFWHVLCLIIMVLFLSFCHFFVLFCFVFMLCWSFVDVPLICSCPSDHVPDTTQPVTPGYRKILIPGVSCQEKRPRYTY